MVSFQLGMRIWWVNPGPLRLRIERAVRVSGCGVLVEVCVLEGVVGDPVEEVMEVRQPRGHLLLRMRVLLELWLLSHCYYREQRF